MKRLLAALSMAACVPAMSAVPAIETGVASQRVSSFQLVDGVFGMTWFVPLDLTTADELGRPDFQFSVFIGPSEDPFKAAVGCIFGGACDGTEIWQSTAAGLRWATVAQGSGSGWGAGTKRRTSATDTRYRLHCRAPSATTSSKPTAMESLNMASKVLAGSPTSTPPRRFRSRRRGHWH